MRAFVLFLVIWHSLNLVHAEEILRGPYLQTGSSTEVTIRWRTDVSVFGEVHFGSNPDSLTSSRAALMDTVNHEVLLDSLLPGTKYYYALGSTGNDSLFADSGYYFSTFPPDGDSKKARIWILGDSGTLNSNGMAVRDAYYQFTDTTHTDLWIMLGDNAYDHATDQEHQEKVFDKFPEMLSKSVLWPALGNHDNDDPLSTFYETFTIPGNTEAYYSFDFGNIHFICLNSWDVSRAPDGEMAQWLMEDLADHQGDWTVAYWHHPPYTWGSHNSDNEIESIEMRQTFLPILETAGVDIVFGGNSHAYERTYLINGHYAHSDSFSVENMIDAGDGSEEGDGAYSKFDEDPGTVYVVAGSSGRLDENPPGGHPAMFTSLLYYGSMVLDIEGLRLDAQFLDKDGIVHDHFTIIKGGLVGSTPPIAPPQSFSLEQNYPNPFNPATVIRYSLSVNSSVTLDIYNLAGQRIRHLAGRSSLQAAHQPAGTYEVSWNGRNDFGQLVTSGIYFYRLAVQSAIGNWQPAIVETRKMVLIR